MISATCECTGSICMVSTDIIQKELTNLGKNSSYTNKQRRFHAYRMVAACSGLTYRQRIPKYVEHFIKGMFPEETGDYIGFRNI